MGKETNEYNRSKWFLTLTGSPWQETVYITISSKETTVEERHLQPARPIETANPPPKEEPVFRCRFCCHEEEDIDILREHCMLYHSKRLSKEEDGGQRELKGIENILTVEERIHSTSCPTPEGMDNDIYPHHARRHSKPWQAE